MLAHTPHTVAARGAYDQITKLVTSASGEILKPDDVIASFSDALPETFVEFDRKGRGDALNLDLYGVSDDRQCAVVQIRHSFCRYKNGHMNRRKDYVLTGVNEETGETFRHPISAAAVRAAIRKNPSDANAAVRGAQRWMWCVTDEQLDAGRRQGDILLVPAKGRPAGGEVIDEAVVTVGGSHEVRARAFMLSKSGIVYAEAPTIRHSKNQHEALYADCDGWYSVRVGREAPTWAWGVRLGD